MECKELNWLCRHMKKVRRSQASISRNSCPELSKTQFFPVSIVNIGSKIWLESLRYLTRNPKNALLDFYHLGLY